MFEGRCCDFQLVFVRLVFSELQAVRHIQLGKRTVQQHIESKQLEILK